jgi:uncharacterized membrane protein
MNATAWMVRPTGPTRFGAGLIVLIVLATAAFLVVRYPALPWLLPVHFQTGGAPNGWQYKTLARVLIPLFVQLALAVSLAAIAALLLSRTQVGHESTAPDVRAAAAAAEAVVLIALIWVAFQGYVAVALVNMWTSEWSGLGRGYQLLEIAGILLTVTVSVRAHARVGKPSARPYVPEHWRLGQLYKNPDDPALFVPTRNGSRWTLNFGRPVAAALLGVILAVGVVAPTVILILALRTNF